MFLASSNKARRLLCTNYIHRVTAEEVRAGREDVRALVAELAPGFTALVDLSLFEAMDPDGVAEIGKMMELIGQSGVSSVVRVIPDPSKDIGLNILSLFHYPRGLQFINCRSLTEAAGHLPR
jgi:hypothetical protein